MIEKPRYSHASRSAQKLLADIKADKLPINLEQILTNLGINLLPYSFPDNISAVLLKEGHMIVVGVNENHHPNRRRFSIAHEIGHYTLGHYKDIFVDSAAIAEGKFDVHDNSHKKVQEQEANHFASELLIPSAMLKKDFSEIRDADKLAKLYKVSKDALWIKLVRLKLV